MTFRAALMVALALGACVESADPPDTRAALNAGPAPAGQTSCYAVQVLHHTHPDNGESSPLCVYQETDEDGRWQNKQVPYPVGVYNPANQTGGINTWFIWSAKDACSETMEVDVGGNPNWGKEQRLVAAVAADRACAAFLPYTSTGAMARTEGRYDKAWPWSGVPNTPNRDFRCWKVPDPPAPVPGEDPPELTAQQQACEASRGNNVDPPPPPMPPPPPETLFAYDTTHVETETGTGTDIVPAPTPLPIDTSFDDQRIDTDGEYIVEYIRESFDPGAIAEGIPGVDGPSGLEVVGTFGGGFVIVRTLDANTGEVLLERSGVAVNGFLSAVDTWGPLAEGSAETQDPAYEPPSITFGSEWSYAYTGAAGDPNDPYFGMPPAHAGGSDPARPGPAGPAHAGGTHATSTPSPVAPPARPTAYTGHTTPPGGQPVAHSGYRPPTAQPWTRPRPEATVRAEIATHLRNEHSRAAAQLRGSNDVVTRERTALDGARTALDAARTRADAAQAAHAADPMNAAKATTARDEALRLANAVGKARTRQAAHDAAEAARVDAMRHEALAKANHELEVKLQELEAAEAGGVVNQNLRNQVTDLARQRDLAEAIVNGEKEPGILQRTGALVVRLAAESPLNPNLPQATQQRVLNHRAHKAHHITAMGVALIAAIPVIALGGLPAVIPALAQVAFHAWRAVDNHLRAEAINRGAAPSAIPDPTGGVPPGPAPGGGGGVTPPPGGTP